MIVEGWGLEQKMRRRILSNICKSSKNRQVTLSAFDSHAAVCISDVRSIEAGEAVPPLSFFKEKEN